MVERLARCGQRSVTALVDISNYVMFEYGRPSHIFDLDKIHDKLVVRWGRAGRNAEAAQRQHRSSVDDAVGVIADAQGGRVAGRHHGRRRDRGVATTRSNVYVEAAFWWPEAVAGPLAPLQLHDRRRPPLRARRRSGADGRAHRAHHAADHRHLRRRGRARSTTRCSSLPERAAGDAARGARRQGHRHAGDAGAMRRACCAASASHFTEAPGALTVTPPSWRFDLQIEEDLIEEVIRVIGYQHAAGHAAAGAGDARACAAEARRSAHAVRHALAALDYQETINFSFVEERWEHELAGNADPIRVLNPIAAPLAVMRSSLIGSLVGVLRYNLARKATRVRVFEVGRVFLRDASVADGAAQRGRRARSRCALPAWPTAPPTRCSGARKERAVDFFDVKGDVEALLAPRAAQLRRRRAPGAAPGPLRARRARRPRHRPSSASCTRAGARPTSCRMRRCCSSSTWTRCWRATLPAFAAGAAPAVGVARPRAGAARQRQRTTR